MKPKKSNPPSYEDSILRIMWELQYEGVKAATPASEYETFAKGHDGKPSTRSMESWKAWREKHLKNRTPLLRLPYVPVPMLRSFAHGRSADGAFVDTDNPMRESPSILTMLRPAINQLKLRGLADSVATMKPESWAFHRPDGLVVDYSIKDEGDGCFWVRVLVRDDGAFDIPAKGQPSESCFVSTGRRVRQFPECLTLTGAGCEVAKKKKLTITFADAAQVWLAPSEKPAKELVYDIPELDLESREWAPHVPVAHARDRAFGIKSKKPVRALAGMRTQARAKFLADDKMSGVDSAEQFFRKLSDNEIYYLISTLESATRQEYQKPTTE